ncbi:uncharacterized protein LOC116850308 [Odontomachus brunneus]|uniref:uncharacterized protein LOC116850308 n=1 Tax=Odontomachus brunneus TaxID=486640 RepID=UPI0013F1EEE5|nr:uncharacterized protein LOC116850308 [Odontomachus brunneus]
MPDTTNPSLKRKLSPDEEDAAKVLQEVATKTTDMETDSCGANKKVCSDIPDRINAFLSNRYDACHPGPYEIIIERIVDKTPETQKSISHTPSELRIGKNISKHLPNLWKNAYDLKHLGNSKFSVNMADYQVANKLVEVMSRKRNDIFPESIWIAYVPNYKIFRAMVTRDLDSTVTYEDMENLDPPPEWQGNWKKPISIQYIKHRTIITKEDNTSEVVYKPTRTNIVTFHYSSVQKSAIYFDIRVYFTLFVQKVRRCTHCQRFGHVSAQCRGGESARVCVKCASKEYQEQNCNSRHLNCINCIRTKEMDTNHAANDYNCPTFIENRRIKIIMAKLGLSPREALAYYKREVGGGTAILIEKSIDFTVIKPPILNDICSNFKMDYNIIKVRWANKNGYICVIYNPPNTFLEVNDRNPWPKLFEYLASLGEIVICGDLNGKHSLWCANSQVPNTNGTLILDAVQNTNLVVLNDDSPTWTSSDGSIQSALDLTIVSSNLATSSTWQTILDKYGSDHFPTVLRLQACSLNKISCRPHYSISRDINSALIEAGASLPKIVNNKRKPPVYWWNEECSLLINEKRDLYQKFKANPSIENINSYLDKCKQIKNKLRKIRNLKFREFFSIETNKTGHHSNLTQRAIPHPTMQEYTNHNFLASPISDPEFQVAIKASCYKKKAPAYADDIIIFTEGKHVYNICKILQNDLVTLNSNLTALDLQISAEKTNLCIFSNMTRFETIRNLVNNTREAYGIIHAIDTAMSLGKKKVGIFTDSLSVLKSINAIDTWGKKPMVCYDIIHKILKARDMDIDITLVWIPGHCGIEGNEMADTLAKLASGSTEAPPRHHLLDPSSICWHMRKPIIEEGLQALETEFKVKGKEYRNHTDLIPLKFRFSGSKKIPRQIITIMARIQSHHICTGSHLLRKNITTTDRCECGFTPRNLEHLLFNCALHIEESDKLITQLYAINIMNIEDIIRAAFSKFSEPFKLILNFLKSTNQSL